MRAIRREIVEIREIGVAGHDLQLVDSIIGAAEIAPVAYGGGADVKGQQLLGRLLVGEAEHKAVSCAMIGELRLKDFLALTLEDIDVPLHEAVGVKAEVAVVKLAVGVDVFGEL